MTVRRFFERLNQFLDNTMLLVCDTGDVIFGGAEMYREQKESHFSQDYYLSIGYSLPAGLGVSLAAPDKRTVVLIGDGALQRLRNNCIPICVHNIQMLRNIIACRNIKTG